MSTSDSFQRDQQPSIGLSINLSSNNPFRNRAASPASPFEDPPARPLSRNPFLDQSLPPVRSPGTMSNHSESKSLSAEEIFNSLTLDDKKGEKKSAPSSGNKQGDLLGLGLDISGTKPAPPNQQQRPGSRPRPGQGESPSRRPPPQQRRPRRNSESSVLDFDATPLTEEEKRIIAARRRENQRERETRGRPGGEGRDGRDKRDDRDKKDDREKREGREKREPRDGKSRGKTGSGRPSRRMDIIDQLDATSIYGHGVFHHDGPFDALNPHRNRQTSRRAPMQAFPKDSLNMSLGGSGPLNKQADHSTFLGHNGEEAFRDYSYSSKDPKDRNGYFSPPATSTATFFDPKSRGDVVHGDESVGLGTSTFLEGTPAARSAIARHHKEQSQEIAEGGLQRKKSLAQRIRGINRPQRDYGAGGRVTSPEGQYNNTRSPEIASAGSESNNPFASEYGKGEEYFSVKPRGDVMSPTSPASYPRRGSAGGPLERRATTDNSHSEENPKPTGILGRMRSLKGGRRNKANDPLSPNAA